MTTGLPFYVLAVGQIFKKGTNRIFRVTNALCLQISACTFLDISDSMKLCLFAE